jgi:hypothetical protein
LLLEFREGELELQRESLINKEQVFEPMHNGITNTLDKNRNLAKNIQHLKQALQRNFLNFETEHLCLERKEAEK